MKNKIIKIIVVGIIVSSFWYVYHPLPKYKGHVSIGGLNKSVDIYTDTYGVPHIFAQNEEDLFYAAGYYAARDRLFQMSVVNYSVRGELAYAFGDELIKSDVYLRTWRIHDTAKKLDETFVKDGVKIIVCGESVFHLLGSEIKWREDYMGNGIEFINPNANGQCGCGESWSL